MIYSHVLSKIVCEEYDHKVRRDITNPNQLYGYPLPRAMLLRFSLDNPNSNSRNSPEKKLEILLFGQSYVTVLTRITNKKSLVDRDFTDEVGWQLESCHDSCWRYDGIEQLINKYGMPNTKENISFIDELFGWYSVHNLTEKEYMYLSKIGRS